MEKLNFVVKEQGKPLDYTLRLLTVLAQRLRILEESNQNLNAALQSFIDEVNHLRSSMSQPVRTSVLLTEFIHIRFPGGRKFSPKTAFIQLGGQTPEVANEGRQSRVAI